MKKIFQQIEEETFTTDYQFVSEEDMIALNWSEQHGSTKKYCITFSQPLYPNPKLQP